MSGNIGPTGQTCAKCIWYNATDDDETKGYCQVVAPQATILLVPQMNLAGQQSLTPQIFTAHPQVIRDVNWCGQFQAGMSFAKKMN